jgi:lipoprotein signal peptidase
MATFDASPALRERFVFIGMPVLLLGVLADQASKSWATLQAVEPRMLVPGYVVAYSVSNAGSILGLGKDQARTAAVFAILGIACAALLVRIAMSDRGRWRAVDYLAGAVLLAGILGNTLDRLALGHVRDFLVTWAIPNLAFNVADLLVVAGGACLLITRYFDRRRDPSEPGVMGRVAA